MMVSAQIVRQAASLLDAVPDSENPVIEVCFNNSKKEVEVWNMLADEERIIGSVEYDEP